VGKEAAAPIMLAQRQDGTWTGRAEEVDAIMRKAWLPVFAKYQGKPRPDFADFKARYRGYIRRVPMELGKLSLAELKQALSRMAAKQAGGRDGWRVAELKSLPDTVLNGLLEIFDLAETEGKWPGALLEAVVTLIPKGESGEPLARRPITVLERGLPRLGGGSGPPAAAVAGKLDPRPAEGLSPEGGRLAAVL